MLFPELREALAHHVIGVSQAQPRWVCVLQQRLALVSDEDMKGIDVAAIVTSDHLVPRDEILWTGGDRKGPGSASGLGRQRASDPVGQRRGGLQGTGGG